MSQSTFFGLSWPGKEAARALADQPVQGSLVHTDPHLPRDVVGFRDAISTHSEHQVLVGDNLDVLKLLPPASVDVIYIDPPYNTGRDFVYKDNYRSRRQFRATDHGMWHAEWLSMMLPRLIIARRVLKPTGFICMSIGEDEVANLRKVADEVFGEECFASQLVWKKAGTGKNDSRYAVVEHEYVLVYAASTDNPGFNIDRQGQKSTKYNHCDERGNYSLVRLDSKTLGYLPTLDFPIAGPDGREYWPDQPAGKEKVARWRWGRDKVESNHADLVFRRGFVYTKNYEKPGARPRSILDGERFGVTRSGRKDAEKALGMVGVFDFPKPVRLIKHLIDICAGSDATVLDFFAGSGTTAQAVLELNEQDGGTRRFQLVQLPQPTHTTSVAHQHGFATIAEICAARVAAVCHKSGQTFAHLTFQPNPGA